MTAESEGGGGALLPIPRAAREVAKRTNALTRRALDALDRFEEHILVLGDPGRVDHVLKPALATVGWEGPKLKTEADPFEFVRRVTAPAVRAAVFYVGPDAVVQRLLEPMQGLLQRLRERVPTVLVDCPEDELPEAYAMGFDLVTPPLHGIYPAADVLTEALRLRTLFGDRCGQGAVDAERPGGEGAPRGRILLVDDESRRLADVVERLIGCGFDWEIRGDGAAVAHSVFRQLERFDLVFMKDRLQGLRGTDLLRLFRHATARMPPCVLFAEELASITAEMAWHAGAWAWCSVEHLQSEVVLDLVRRGMNMSRAVRREAA